MNPRQRRIIIARVLDPKYEHPKSMRWEIRVKRIYKRIYPDGIEALVLSPSPILGLVKRDNPGDLLFLRGDYGG